MALKLETALFAYGLHKKKKHPKTNKRFIDVGRLSGTGLAEGFTVSVASTGSTSTWEGTLTQDHNAKDPNGYPYFLAADLQVEVETRKKAVRGTEDITVTVTNPADPNNPSSVTVKKVDVIP